tara:strand:+ start:85 stop:828 length:744 start_codon:yes stop_codon:yes gene_type:complete
MSKLKLAIPSKGRLMDLTIDWFKRRGVQIDSAMSSREYSAYVSGMPQIQVVLLAANEIPKGLATGRIDLGVTGQDLVRENVPTWNEILFELEFLNFGKSDLVLAVPKFWVDVESIDDFDAVAINFRRKNGYRLRIATKYHNLIWSYLRKMGVADYQLIDSQGATEGTVKNGIAEAIGDITSSGRTLDANHLKIIGDQPILSSQATLYLSGVAPWSAAKYRILQEFSSKIGIRKWKTSILSNTNFRKF